MDKDAMHIIMVGDVVLSIDCLRELFCCDMQACKGICCVEGDAGAPITPDEVVAIESILPQIRPYLSKKALQVLDRQGVAYRDEEGDLVTSIVNGKDCVFTCYDEGGNCLCAIQKAQMRGEIDVRKPLSCSLYPIREKNFAGGLVGLNYHRWNVCQEACKLGRKLHLPVYKFLKEPLIQRFGAEWYAELEETAENLRQQGIL